MNRFTYDTDDFGHDQYEFEAEFEEGGLLDSMEGAMDGEEAQGPTEEGKDSWLGPVDLRENPEDVPVELGIANPWDFYVEHAQFFEPADKDYYRQWEEERYWGFDHHWEKRRHAESKRVSYWKNPEKSRARKRQQKMKEYWKDPDKAREATRKRVAAYRARKRAEKEAKKNVS